MIIDTFMFNGEYSSLKIRLDELYSIVDLFIICESKYTHSGIKKEKLFTDNCKILDQYKNKILIVIDHKKHFTRYAPIREMLQRQLISKELKKIRLKKSDLIIHSDCDEIPRKNIIESLVKKKEECNVLLQMNNYVNYLNIYAGSWVRARVVSFAHYRTIQNMRKDIFLYQAFNKRRHRLPFIRVPNYFTARRFFLWKIPEIIYQKPNIEIISNAGWHFNNLFEVDTVLSKIQNSSHTELNTDMVRSEAKNRFLKGQDIYTGQQYEKVKIDLTFPKIVYQMPNEWKNHIFR